MAVSKRLRFEILRRDNFTCRYCGHSAPDVELRVDHVIPVTLGGADEPSNLVSSCEPCNAGKSSTSPDAPTVDDVAQDALRWAQAMERAAAIQSSEREQFQRYADRFGLAWTDWTMPGTDDEWVPLPDDWTRSLHRFFVLGLEIDVVRYAVREAMQAPGVRDRFRYFAGICWRHLEGRQQIARSLLEPDDQKDT